MLAKWQSLPRLARLAEQKHHHTCIVVRFRHADHALRLAPSAHQREYVEQTLAWLRTRSRRTTKSIRVVIHPANLSPRLGHLRGYAPIHPPNECLFKEVVFKEVEKLRHALALYFMFYNFGRIHQTLRATPVKGAGIANHVWSLNEIVSLVG